LPSAGLIARLLKIDQLSALYETARSDRPLHTDVLRELRIESKITPEDLKKIPTTGAVIAVSNHPFGLLDGMLLSTVLSGVRPDLRVLTNHMLGGLPELAKLGIFIDPFDRPESRLANGRALKQAISHVRSGGMLLIFPAGEVAHFDFRSVAVRDPEWRATAARLVRITGAKALPIFVRGANSLPFQMLGMVHPRLRTAALPSELLNKRGRCVEVRIGSVVESAQIQALPNDDAAIRYLRLRTELLARRGENEVAVLSDAAPIAQTSSPDALAREIATLPGDALLDESGELGVYVASAKQIPLVLDEIGRLREVTFRAAGEGSGRARDLDRFDSHYLHLFLWNREKREVVGAYRVGDVPEILRAQGRKGLYTQSLFRFGAGFPEGIGPAYELGRSWVRPEYQRKFAPLLLLWKGISGLVWRNPEYSTLIGAVSVSNQYSTASRELIARYFEREKSKSVKARKPLRGNPVQQWELRALCSLMPDVDDLSDPIADLEPDGKGIPILVKQYVKLGGRMLAFSVDPKFGNTLDGFVMLDLRNTQPEVLARYMGKERTRQFLEWHSAVNPRVA
jgi:putative hemolysin